MIQRIICTTLLALLITCSFAQECNTDQLDKFFASLEQRNEAMASICISKNGKILYQNEIGFRSISDEEGIKSDSNTNYRIWSITKMYTATMIMQLLEEGQLSLETTLDQFYPAIPNADIITIQDMLNHKSGIHDYIQNPSSEDWDAHITDELTHDFMVNNIAQYPSDFPPKEGFNYSNSNYLLLGYIIEEVDGQPYQISLTNRISLRAGLSSTHFGLGALDSIENKAYSYQYNGRWNLVDEGDFSGLTPAGAGGIVSTTHDMTRFIEALFAGKLISESSIDKMLPIDEFYKLGMMQTIFQETYKGYGHTGGSRVTESSLYYYPEDSIAIAYATNGIVIRKEEILDNVLEIIHHKPFAISINRPLQGLLIFSFVMMLLAFMKLRLQKYLNQRYLLQLGWGIAIVFWVGQLIAGLMHEDYSFKKEALTQLDSFYSVSGSFMAGVQFTIAILSIPFIWVLYKSCKKVGVGSLPILPLILIPCSMFGISMFPIPSEFYFVFVNSIILVLLGPLLAIVFWRKPEESLIRWLSAISLFFMLVSIGFVISRSTIPELVHEYWGLIQRLLYLGWTSWIVFLGMYFNYRRSNYCSTLET